MKVLMLLPVNSQPRLIKRVRMMLEQGHEVTVAYQIRDYFKKNYLPDECEKVPLVYIENGKYYKRIPKLLKSVSILRSTGKRWDLVYTFSYDLLLLSFFVKATKRYYEIGDLRIIDSRLYNLSYKKLLKKQDKVIVTSDKFSQFLQERYDLDATKIEVIENKLNPISFVREWTKKRTVNDGRTKVGIIGLLRYRQVLDFLTAVKSGQNNLEVHIYGSGVILDEVLTYVDNLQVFYHGEFKYPDDLNSIYQHVDISFVMYNSDDMNVRLALPNKLYESIYYQIPMIVSSNTYLSEKVLTYDIGLTWDIRNIYDLPAEIENIVANGQYEKFVENCQKIDRRDIFISSEYFAAVI